jgi:hypothetical protein
VARTVKKGLVTAVHRWDKSDLERRIFHALDIAKQAVERLASTGYTDPDEPGNSIRPEKLISETALLLYATLRIGDLDALRARVECVAELLIPHARSERLLLEVCLQPALAWDYAQAHILLSRLGYQDSGFDALLERIVSSEARAGRERTPHRMLEQEWIRDTWTDSRIASRQFTPSAVLNSALNQSMDLLNGSREDIYAFTHALMYVTGFNISPRRLPRARVVILAEAEAALARCLDDQDYDLCGELLLAWPLTGATWSAAATFGFHVLARVEDQAGFLPAPTTRLERLEKLQGGDRTNYLLATAYHTAYVMGLLCVAALQSGRSPPSRIPTNATARGSANIILQFLDADGPTTHWRDQLNQLNDPERDAIAGLLFGIALRRKVSQREFGAVRQLLKAGYDLGLADTPASSQAAEMLERLATFSTLRGRRDGSGIPQANDEGVLNVEGVTTRRRVAQMTPNNIDKTGS